MCICYHSGLILPFLTYNYNCSVSTQCQKDQKFNRFSEEPISEAKMENIDLSYNFLKIDEQDEFRNKHPGMFETNGNMNNLF